MIRAVLDTNIIVSGLFWQGPPRAVLRAGIVQTFALLFSPELITEVQEVISREKFARACAALGKTAAEIVADLRSTAELVTPAPIPPDAIRDPKDIPVLACAVGGKAGYIVTGDDDLLTLKNYQGVLIVAPAVFLEHLATRNTE